MSENDDVIEGSATTFKILTASAVIMAIIMSGAVMHFAQHVFVPIIMAWILAQMLAPLMRTLGKWRVPYSLCIIIVISLLILAFY